MNTPILQPITKTAAQYEADTRRLLNMGGPAYLQAKTAEAAPAEESVKIAELLKLSDGELLKKMAAADPMLAHAVVACTELGPLQTDCKVAERIGDADMIARTNANLDAFLKTAVIGAPTPTTKGELLSSFLRPASPTPPGAPDQNINS